MNNEVNIIITSLDALEEWTPVLNADLGEKREVGIADEGRRHRRSERRRRNRGNPRLPSEMQRSHKVEVGLTREQWAETAAPEHLII